MVINPMKNLYETIVAVYGQKGLDWWSQLPAQLEKLSDKYHLTLLPTFEDLSFNFVAPVIGPNQQEWVIKCSVPDIALRHEINALIHYAGYGAVRCMSYNPEEGWMLLEQCKPGTRLLDLKEQSNTTLIAAEVMQKLWKPVAEQNSFPTLVNWLEGLKCINENVHLKKILPQSLRGFVQCRSQELLHSQGEQVLLHGDLHHYNILKHHDKWIAIDPKGVIGEREYEIGAFLRNPLTIFEQPILTKEVEYKLDQIIELTGLDRQKALSWSIIQAVLCVCWAMEDNLFKEAQDLSSFANTLYLNTI